MINREDTESTQQKTGQDWGINMQGLGNSQELIECILILVSCIFILVVCADIIIRVFELFFNKRGGIIHDFSRWNSKRHGRD